MRNGENSETKGKRQESDSGHFVKSLNEEQFKPPERKLI